MRESVCQAFDAIPIPAGMEKRILTACLEISIAPATTPRRTAVRWMTPVVSLAACAAVLFVTLSATGRLPGWFPGKEWIPAVSDDVDKNNDTSGTTESTTSTTNASKDTTSGTADTSAPPSNSTTASVNKTTIKKHTTTKNVNATTKKGAIGTTANTKPGSVTTTAGNKQAYYGIFEEMTVTQLEAYFGRRVQPTWVPDDLEWIEPRYTLGVYHKDEAYFEAYPDAVNNMIQSQLIRNAEITHDCNRFYYMAPGDRNLSISVCTAPYPRVWLGDVSRLKEEVSVNGVAIRLAYYDDSAYTGRESYCYSALFKVDTVEYYLDAWNIPRDEFLRIIESLL